MKKLLIITFTLFLLVSNVNAYDIDEEDDTLSKNILVVNIDNSQVIYSKGKEGKIYPASMSKIMTAIILAENANLEEEVTVIEKDLEGLKEAEASVIGFEVNEKVKVKDLLYAILLPSGADACNVATRITFKDNEEFVKQMNIKAKEIGMDNTNFVNNTGLHDDNHYSTTYDIYLLMKYALSNKEVSEALSASKYNLSTNMKTYILMPSALSIAEKYNIDLSYYEAGKTGYTQEAGRCLVALYEHDNERYIIISSGGDEHSSTSVSDHKKMSDKLINDYNYKRVYKKNHEFAKLDVKYSFSNTISVKSKSDIYLVLPNDYDKNKLRVEYKEEIKLIAPLEKNTHIGSSVFYYDNQEIYTIKHYLQEDINKSEILYYSDLSINFIKDNILIVIAITLVVIALIYALIRKNRYKN